MSKYLPLSERLARESADTWRATLAEIEAVLGSALPKAAQQNAWWTGAEKPHHRAWLDHGWRVEALDRASGVVSFRRAVAPQVAAPEAAEVSGTAQRAVGAAALIGAGVAVAAGIGLFAVKLLRGRRV